MSSKMPESTQIADVSEDLNTIARFLAHEQIPSIQEHDPVDCIVICASAVLTQASHIFSALESRPSLARTLVLVGGIGHSTSLIYEAVARHPTYHTISDQVHGLPESRVLLLILKAFFDIERIESNGCRVLVEDRSTNCGANALETREVLDGAGVTDMNSCIVVQDPTMSLRTIASFEKAYEDLPRDKRPSFLGCPIFVPVTRTVNGELQYDLRGREDLREEDFWEMKRFCELLVGEVARLKDDENGYGPRGKGFIGHVDVSTDIDLAAKHVREVLQVDR